MKTAITLLLRVSVPFYTKPLPVFPCFYESEGLIPNQPSIGLKSPPKLSHCFVISELSKSLSLDMAKGMNSHQQHNSFLGTLIGDFWDMAARDISSTHLKPRFPRSPPLRPPRIV
ncbi:hypothetical protein B0T21DRAFT_11776 [Apiosordaria backusii]|uniref:Uncharacterized protein n=1 Tax=Apiosordaria backusii TaxID=314023 RepID=A0AA40K6J6_9PEZI|nr:hypothetical protein B0T21DRAFT_11776 [Apiosordaria backusii]